MSPPGDPPRGRERRPSARGGGLAAITAGRRRAARRAARGRPPRRGRARARSRRRRRSTGSGTSRSRRAGGRRVELAQQVQPRPRAGGSDRLAGRAGCAGRRRGSGRSRRSRRGATWRAAPSSAMPRARAAAVARASGGSPDVPVAGAGAVDLDRVLEPLLAQQRRASRPRPSASGRCCPCRRRGGGPRADRMAHSRHVMPLAVSRAPDHARHASA